MLQRMKVAFAIALLGSISAGCAAQGLRGPVQAERVERQRFAWRQREAADSANFTLKSEELGRPDTRLTYYLDEHDSVIAYSICKLPNGYPWCGVVDKKYPFATYRARFNRDTVRVFAEQHIGSPIDSLELIASYSDENMRNQFCWHIWTRDGPWYFFIDDGSFATEASIQKRMEEYRKIFISSDSTKR